jgi:hypothetical protein
MKRTIATPAIALLAAALPVTVLPVHADPAPPTTPYYEEPCTDLDHDRIDDFFGRLPLETTVDIMLIFNADTYEPRAAEAAVRAALNDPNGAFIRYVSEYSPYIFIHGVTLQHPVASTPVLSRLLDLDDVMLVRPYQRFRIVTTQTIVNGGSPDGWHPEYDPGSGGGNPPTSGAPGSLSLLGSADPFSGGSIYPQPANPDVLVYFVDSGMDGETWWAIDATTDDPLDPAGATDPTDITGIRHGSFLGALAGGTILAAKAQQGGGAIAFADVKVALAPGGETTTLELTRALDAIKAHLLYEEGRGRNFRAVINISYDTDGGIANHDIIYPNPGGRRGPLDPKGMESRGEDDPGTDPVDPCAHVLFDMVYGDVLTNHDVVVCVGAGNDGERAPYILNEVGRSANTTLVVAALNAKGSAPATYSNYGLAPLGTNGHPDLAATGQSGAPEFEYRLEGTSIATALTSAMAAVTLSRYATLSPLELRQKLTLSGQPLAPYGDRLYGRAKLSLPWSLKMDVTGPRSGAIDLEASPNPLRAVTHLHFSTAAAGEVTLDLFDVQGRRVRRLHAGTLPAGRHALPFDGRGADGEPLASGLYFGRVEAPGGAGVARVVIDR